jgi:hypothetical protein
MTPAQRLFFEAQLAIAALHSLSPARPESLELGQVNLGMGKKNIKCPELGCGHDTVFVRALCELVPAPVSMRKEDLERKPPLGELMRNFLVECPVHGEKNCTILGHHISTIPRNPNGLQVRADHNYRHLSPLALNPHFSRFM